MVKLVPSLQQGNLINGQKAVIAQYKVDNPLLSNDEVAAWGGKQFHLAKAIYHTTVSHIAKQKITIKIYLFKINRSSTYAL